METGCKFKTLRSDNGGKYTSNEFKHYLQEHRIRHQLTFPVTPQQNGVAKRMNRTLMNITRALLLYKNIPPYLWVKATNTAIHILNTLCPVAHSPTPQEQWTGTPLMSVTLGSLTHLLCLHSQ